MYVRLERNDNVKTFGIRASAVPYREAIERGLHEDQKVVIDFHGYEATQSFIDELIGALVLKQGRQVLARLIFENCTNEVKGIIRFVVGDRVKQLSNLAAA